MGEILYRRQLIQINLWFVLTLARSCVSLCIFTMASSSASTAAGMPQLPLGYSITEYIRRFMLRGRAVDGNSDYEAATCTAHLQH